VVFPSVYDRTRQFWIQDKVILVKGKVSEKEERITILVDDVRLLAS